MLDLVFNNSTKYTRFGADFFQNVLECAVSELKLKGNIEVSVNIVSPRKIKSLNNTYRKKNKVTDVLSFPLSDDSLKKYDIMPLGDIFICADYVERKISRLLNGQENPDQGLSKTMAHLAVHGFLHLLGYDHEISKNDAELMFQKEEKILNKFLKRKK